MYSVILMAAMTTSTAESAGVPQASRLRLPGRPVSAQRRLRLLHGLLGALLWLLWLLWLLGFLLRRLLVLLRLHRRMLRMHGLLRRL